MTNEMAEISIYRKSSKIILEINGILWGVISREVVEELHFAGCKETDDLYDHYGQVDFLVDEVDLFDIIDVEDNKDYLQRKLDKLVDEHEILKTDGEPLTARYDLIEEIEIIAETLNQKSPIKW